jgi:hypothetical protein
MLSFVDYETCFILKNSVLNLRSKFMYLLTQLGQLSQYIDWVNVLHPILERDYSVPNRPETSPGTPIPPLYTMGTGGYFSEGKSAGQ